MIFYLILKESWMDKLVSCVCKRGEKMVINVWHLLWIIPLSASVGMVLTGIVSANRERED